MAHSLTSYRVQALTAWQPPSTTLPLLCPPDSVPRVWQVASWVLTQLSERASATSLASGGLDSRDVDESMPRAYLEFSRVSEFLRHFHAFHLRRLAGDTSPEVRSYRKSGPYSEHAMVRTCPLGTYSPGHSKWPGLIRVLFAWSRWPRSWSGWWRRWTRRAKSSPPSVPPCSPRPRYAFTVRQPSSNFT